MTQHTQSSDHQSELSEQTKAVVHESSPLDVSETTAFDELHALADYYEQHFGKYMGCSGNTIADSIRNVLANTMTPKPTTDQVTPVNEAWHHHRGPHIAPPCAASACDTREDGMNTILRKTWSISGADLKKQMAEDEAFKADRRSESGMRLRFMTNAAGYVMVRHPSAMPFVLSEQEWQLLPPFDAASIEPRR